MALPWWRRIRGLTLSNAMYLSSWLDRMVEISFDEELFLQELNKKRAISPKKTGSHKEKFMFENIVLTGFADEIAASLDTQMQVLEKLHMNNIEMRGVDGSNYQDHQ